MSSSPQAEPTAFVRRVWSETPSLKGVLLEVSQELQAAHLRPAQYVVVHREPATKVFLAIASAPAKNGQLELLLGPAAEQKLNLKEGENVRIDPPAGKGFPIEEADGRDVLLFSVGSAISAIRPMVNALRSNRASVRKVHLYTGARSAEEHAYRGEEAAWRADGVEIVRAVSKPWVQDLFADHAHPVDEAIAFVAGTKPMIEAVTDVLIKRGLPKERVKTNW